MVLVWVVMLIVLVVLSLIESFCELGIVYEKVYLGIKVDFNFVVFGVLL